MKLHLLAIGLAAALATLVSACGSDDAPVASTPATPEPARAFNRVATFPVCAQVGASCESGDTTAAEIVAASDDGMTLVYTNSPKKEIGFVDIRNVRKPAGLGTLAMGGEPTSVAVLGANALVAVNTSASFTAPSGKLSVVDIATRRLVADIALPGQPDSIARSADGKFIAVVIENERDESLGNGAPPQLPGGSLVIVDVAGAPSTWKTRTVSLTNLPGMLFPTDPEPEYVSINDDNIAVVSLQENNHIALVNLATGAVTASYSAGSVSLTQIDTTDERPNSVVFSQSQANRLREPDGMAWISKDQFASANEGDLNGGSRSFTVFNRDGSVAFEAGNALEHAIARVGHTNDRRSDAKGNEPENVAFGRYGSKNYLFVASERSSVVAVYDVADPKAPKMTQILPAALAPEGLLTIPSRNLMIAASEEDDRSILARSSLNIYELQDGTAAYPTLQSANRADGTPIPFAALSGLAAAPTGSLVYAVDDSFFRGNRIFEIDTASKPASLNREIRITDPNRRIAALAAVLPDASSAAAFDDADLTALVNADGSVNIDPEGIAVASTGGFWIASEGNGSVAAAEAGRPILTENLIFKTSATGVIEDIIRLPDAVNAKQFRFGFEGVAESDGKLVVAFQRAWAGDALPRLGIFNLTSRTWTFAFYPLDPVSSPNGGWVGLSDITALGNDRYLIVERDNQGGPDARVKRLYRISLAGVTDGATVQKVLVRDLMADLAAPGGLIPEKIEGSARLANGDVVIVNDNDGVNENSGEIQLLNLGKIAN